MGHFIWALNVGGSNRRFVSLGGIDENIRGGGFTSHHDCPVRAAAVIPPEDRTLYSVYMSSKVLQMLVPEGNPNGMKIIELAGWSGKCFIAPRQNIRELKDRVEINQPGLYFLFGVDEGSSEDLVYIGELANSDQLAGRFPFRLR